jgi:hypothetical protein
VESAWPITGRKAFKQCLLEDGRTVESSIGLPVGEDSEAVAMFRVVLSEMKHLWQLRCGSSIRPHSIFRTTLISAPCGKSPAPVPSWCSPSRPMRAIFAPPATTISSSSVASIWPRRWGQFRGTTRFSKYGNARLRCAFWMPATIAAQQTEKSSVTSSNDISGENLSALLVSAWPMRP